MDSGIATVYAVKTIGLALGIGIGKSLVMEYNEGIIFYVPRGTSLDSFPLPPCNSFLLQ